MIGMKYDVKIEFDIRTGVNPQAKEVLISWLCGLDGELKFKSVAKLWASIVEFAGCFETV